MTSHDQLSKSLIKIFFTDFVRLVLPELVSRLKTGEATFLDKEVSTDWPVGDKREVATAVFRYRVLGLSGCQAEDWLTRPEPIAWAFAALMRPGSWSQAELKLACLRRIAASKISGLRKQILVDWVETYVELSEQDALELQRLLELEGNEEIKAMELTWLGKAEARGIVQGTETATRQAVERMRRVVLRQVEQRFGKVPAPVRQSIEAINDLERLAILAEKAPFVPSIADLGLA